MKSNEELAAMRIVDARIDPRTEGWQTTIIRDDHGVKHEETLPLRNTEAGALGDVLFYAPGHPLVAVLSIAAGKTRHKNKRSGTR